MEQTVINATEYRELPLSLLNESKTTPAVLLTRRA